MKFILTSLAFSIIAALTITAFVITTSKSSLEATTRPASINADLAECVETAYDDFQSYAQPRHRNHARVMHTKTTAYIVLACGSDAAP